MGIDPRLMKFNERRFVFSFCDFDTELYDRSVRDALNLHHKAGVTDSDLWESLALVELTERLTASDHGLDSSVQAAFAFSSLGERQRFALAQVLLDPTRFLFVDEGFSGIDTGMIERILIRLKQNFSQIYVISHHDFQNIVFYFEISLGGHCGT
jgi:ABC-type transport system involved in cytochrome bd biosynthesis fused ATPase/permease subunit